MSVWKSHEKLSLLRRNFLLMKSHEIMSGLNTVKQKHSMFQTIFVLSGMHFKSLSMKKKYFKFPRTCKNQTIHRRKNIHILCRQS